MSDIQQRFLAACRDLHRDCNRGFDSGTNLVGIIELPNGKPAQIHVTMVTDDLEFLDADSVTGCADDLECTVSDFEQRP